MAFVVVWFKLTISQKLKIRKCRFHARSTCTLHVLIVDRSNIHTSLKIYIALLSLSVYFKVCQLNCHIMYFPVILSLSNFRDSNNYGSHYYSWNIGLFRRLRKILPNLSGSLLKLLSKAFMLTLIYIFTDAKNLYIHTAFWNCFINTMFILLHLLLFTRIIIIVPYEAHKQYLMLAALYAYENVMIPQLRSFLVLVR